jgi:hypothetical protein
MLRHTGAMHDDERLDNNPNLKMVHPQNDTE